MSNMISDFVTLLSYKVKNHENIFLDFIFIFSLFLPPPVPPQSFPKGGTSLGPLLFLSPWPRQATLVLRHEQIRRMPFKWPLRTPSTYFPPWPASEI